MNVSDNERTDTRISSVDGTLRIIVRENVVQSVVPCSDRCILSSLLSRKVQLLPLGGTRKDTPGIRIDGSLYVTNVFTWSRREWWPVDRTYRSFVTALQRIQDAHVPNIVHVEALCACSTKMEFLDGYQLLDNTSTYTPPQHRSSCWADSHSKEEFFRIYTSIQATVEALHNAGVVHTDITGFNILVNEKNEFKIIDIFSCIIPEAIGPKWLPSALKKWAGNTIEQSQIDKYLLQPALRRWGST